MEKSTLRAHISHLLRTFPLSARHLEDASICAHLRSQLAQTNPEILIGYRALSDEVNLSQLYETEHLLRDVILIDADTRLGDILPLCETWNHVSTTILVPGRVFDASGHRIGRGGGWYDRFLRDLPAAYKIGISWSIQEVETLRPDVWDIPLDEVVFGKQ